MEIRMHINWTFSVNINPKLFITMFIGVKALVMNNIVD